MSRFKLCIVGATVDFDESEDGKSIKLIYDATKRQNVEITNIPKGKLQIITNSDEISISGNNVNIEEQNAFLFRMITNFIDPETKIKTRVFPEIVMIAKLLNEKYDKPVFDRFLLTPNPVYTKIVQYYDLIKAGLPVIPTYVFMRSDELKSNLDKLEFPLFMKPANGSQGKGTYLFQNKQELLDYVNNTHTSVIFFPNILQRFVPNDGDYRVLVLGEKVIACVKKHRGEGAIVANMSQGSEAEPVTPDAELAEMAIKAARSLGMDFAGVDIIEDKVTGKRYILEVNLSPQITLTTKFSHIDIADQLVEFIVINSK